MVGGEHSQVCGGEASLGSLWRKVEIFSTFEQKPCRKDDVAKNCCERYVGAGNGGWGFG
jgi:hypothetical protein